MKHTFAHFNFNVKDLNRSIAFYKEALGLQEKSRKEAQDGSFTLVYLTDETTSFSLELTWLRDWEKEGYDLGDNEMHLAMATDDFDGSFQKHRDMDCICYENTDMGIYFISDPDGYWIEIVPQRG